MGSYLVSPAWVLQELEQIRSNIGSRGLVLHEFAANAEQHGAWSSPEGRVTVDWCIVEGGEKARLEWRESGGPTVDEARISPGVGTAIMDRIVRSATGKIERVWKPHGLEAVVEVTI